MTTDQQRRLADPPIDWPEFVRPDPLDARLEAARQALLLAEQTSRGSGSIDPASRRPEPEPGSELAAAGESPPRGEHPARRRSSRKRKGGPGKANSDGANRDGANLDGANLDDANQGDASDRGTSGSQGRSRNQPTSGVGGDAEPDPHSVARTIALRQLTMGPRTRVQLEQKLAARGCEPEVAKVVLDRLTDVGLIDDQAFAEMFVRSRRETKGSARRSLAHELRRKGVDDDIIDNTLAGIDSNEESEQARALVRKRLRSLHGLDAQVQTRRLAGMLARKGYGAGVSYTIIRQELAVADEHQRD